jgi:hypothetical protein
MPSASIVASRTWLVQNLHQEVRMENNKETGIVLQRKLRLEEEEIWTELPESNTAADCGANSWKASSTTQTGGPMNEKIKGYQLERGAYVYVRQSTLSGAQSSGDVRKGSMPWLSVHSGWAFTMSS